MKKNQLIRKTLNLFFAINLFGFILFFTGCQEKDYYDPNARPPGYVGDDPSSLDFSTTQTVKFDLNYEVPEGTVSTFLVFSENPFAKGSTGKWELRSDLQPVSSGISLVGSTEIVRTLPAYINELYVYSPSLFVPTLMYAKINNERAVFQQVDLSMPINEEPTSRSMGTGSFDHYLTGKSMTKVNEGAGIYYYRPQDQYITKEEFPVTVRNAITNAFPNGIKVDPKYYTDAAIYIEQDGGAGEGVDLWVSVVSAQAQFNNSLAYFCYDGPKEDLARMTQSERSQFYVVCVFQFAKSSPTMYGALRPGEYVKLKYYDKSTGQLKDKFPVGTTVGWVLSSNGFVTSGSNCYTKNKSEAPWYYSTPSWNFEFKDKNHTIIFTATDKGKEYVCFGFEDENNDYIKGDGDCNDVIFHVKMQPSNAIIPPPTIPEEGEFEQTDQQNGYLAFEDYWPKKGDYDLNDVVVKYESTITYAHKIGAPVPTRVALAPREPYVKKVVDKFSLVHAGADFDNAFAYKVDIAPEKLTKLTVDNASYTIVPDGSGFLVELCPNVNKVIVPYEYGTTPKEYNVVMEFSNEQGTCVTQDEFNQEGVIAPYNPYISPRSGVEVHLPMYLPTAKAESSLFGTEDDRSGNGLWYVSGDKNYYPFAIHLSGINEFTIPTEKESIDKTYPKYVNWVESNKTKDKDWYMYPKTK